MQLRSTCGRCRSSASHRQMPHGRLSDPRLRRLGVEPLESRRLLSVFVVENLDDSGDGSLRAAIDAANANPGSDTIEFAVAGTIYVQSELPAVNDSPGTLLIDGTTAPGYAPGEQPVVVLRGSQAPQSATGLVVEADTHGNEIRGLRISSFENSGVHNSGTLTVCCSDIGPNSSSRGGGIYNAHGNLTVTNTAVSHNSTWGHDNDGGGIYNDGGTLTVTSSTISGNSTGGSGGGIDNYEGTLTVTDSTISSNSGRFGGGIYNSPGGTLAVANSNISFNSADNGGGIDNYLSEAALVVTDTIFRRNSAARGGAIRHYSDGPLTVTGSTISENSANAGGGIHKRLEGTLTVIGSTISGNSAEFSAGGGIDNDDGAVTVTDSSILGNRASGDGGGIETDRSTLTISNVTISDNSAQRRGGGIANSSGTVTITDSTISGNSAGDHGGGVFGGAQVVTNSTISGNLAGENGGGVYGGESLVVTNSTFSGNWANENGGGIYNTFYGTLNVTNSTISGNVAKGGDSDGGGIYNEEGTVSVTNSTLSGNSAARRGSGICDLAGTLTMNNSIISLNDGDDLSLQDSSIDAAHCLIAIDPAFARNPSPGPDGQWATDDDDPGDLHLTDRSPGIDHGDNALAVDPEGTPLQFDLDGNPRISGSRVDVGAYEFQGQVAPGRETARPVVDVLDDVVDPYDGQISLREAILYSDCDELDGPVTFDPSLDGGTTTLGGSPLYFQRGVAIEASELGGLTVDAAGQSGVVVNLADGTELSGLTMTGGIAINGGGIGNYGTLAITGSTISDNAGNQNGGGIYNRQGSVTVTDSTISNNSAYYDGGGIYNFIGGTLTLTNCSVSGNTSSGIYNAGEAVIYATIISANSDYSGGGIYNYRFATLAVTDSDISGNTATGSTGGGGGICNRGGTVTVTDSTLAANSAAKGGGIYGGTMLTVTRSTITGNSAIYYGGGIYNDGGTSTVTHSTIVDNSASYDGGGIFGEGGTWTVTHSSIAENSAAEDGGGIYGEGGTWTVAHSTVVENSADGDGGGIYGYASTWTVTDAVIRDNSAYDGGGIYNGYGEFHGPLAVTDSTITGNSAADDGGGILCTRGTLTVANTTVSENSVGDNGGGIYGFGSTVTVTDTTIAGNLAAELGGGVRTYDATLAVTNTTVAGNSAREGGGVFSYIGALTFANSTIARNAAEYQGGGINGDGSTVTITNSIVAQNDGGAHTDVRGPLADGSDYNLIGIWTGLESPPSNSLVGTVEEPLDPRLGPLGDYGGATWTMPLLGDSPAIDAGQPDPADPPATDQRGKTRIVDGDGDGTARIDMGAFEYLPGEALVFGRHVFYNASSFDGEDPAANQADDVAVAPDKVALLPGDTAAFDNYTSYSRGINGIMIDIAELAGTPTGEDFEFRVGNDDEPGGWPAAATPEISVRQGAGIAGSDRITLVWPENTIQKQWLQVTVLPGGNTGLLEPDVFYYGNAIGESGNSSSDAKVNAYDMLGARDNQRTFINPAEIDFAYDYDRDARVNAYDMLIARDNQTHFLNALKLITVPSVEAQPNQSRGGDILRDRLSWLYEFDPRRTPDQSSEKGDEHDELLEKAWAAYGL